MAFGTGLRPTGGLVMTAASEAERLERNKRLVEDFLAVAHGDLAGLDRLGEFAADDYIQHNPNIGQGLDGLRTFFTHILSLPPAERLDPAKEIEVHLIAEGDLVVRHEIREDGLLINVFRIENGLLKEHWDAFRPPPGGTIIHGLE
jgi:predicted SnoaL-like aldol condensation-catalyzing enzyme